MYIARRKDSSYHPPFSSLQSPQQSLQSCVKTFTSNQSGPIEAWYGEVSAGMEALVQQNKGLRKEVDEKEGLIQEKEVAVDDLKADVLKHKDDASRYVCEHFTLPSRLRTHCPTYLALYTHDSLRHELLESGDRLSKEKRAGDEKLADAHEETERVRKEKNEAERRFRRLQESLDFSNAQNLNLQSQCQQLAKEVAELRADQALMTKVRDAYTIRALHP